MDNHNGQNQYAQQQYGQVQQAPQMQYQQAPQMQYQQAPQMQYQQAPQMQYQQEPQMQYQQAPQMQYQQAPQMQYQQAPQMQYQQAPQMQYQQVPQMQTQQVTQNVQDTQSQMTQQQQVNSGYVSQVNNTKPKKNWFKKILIIGIPAAVVSVFATILLFVLFGDKYDIKDANEFKKVCANTLNKELKKSEMTEQEKSKYAIKSCYTTGDIVFSDLQWIEFESEDDAKAYFAYMTYNAIYGIEYRSLFYSSNKSGVKIEENYVEARSIRDSSDIWKIIIVQEDEYCVFVRLTGDRKDVDEKSEKFLREITK